MAPVPGIDKETSRRALKRFPKRAAVLPLRTIRIQRDLTQAELAERAGMHRNSIRKIEKGITREVTAENAQSLAAALEVTVKDLGLCVRPAAGSIRLRQLTREQRQILDELLSLPPDDYALIRDAVDVLRAKQKTRRARGARK
jgi:transcriptional regulator with XRE-family HTH domain